MQTKVFVTGDLNVDYMATGVILGGSTCANVRSAMVGGSGFNAALAFKRKGFQPILFGKVGNDLYGNLILSELERHQIPHCVEVDKKKPTCVCNIIYFQGEQYPRTIYYQRGNANDYSPSLVLSALKSVALCRSDFIFVPLHIYDQVGRDLDHCRVFVKSLRSSEARIVLDIVPHRIYEALKLDELQSMIDRPVFMIIGEYHTFMRLIDMTSEVADGPTLESFDRIVQNFSAKYFVCRYGV